MADLPNDKDGNTRELPQITRPEPSASRLVQRAAQLLALSGAGAAGLIAGRLIPPPRADITVQKAPDRFAEIFKGETREESLARFTKELRDFEPEINRYNIHHLSLKPEDVRKAINPKDGFFARNYDEALKELENGKLTKAGNYLLRMAEEMRNPECEPEGMVRHRGKYIYTRLATLTGELGLLEMQQDKAPKR